MIGIFDSGIGGLTTVKAIKDLIPDADIVYFGDTARTPYGSKSADTIKNYSLENAKFLIDKGAKIIVIACNSASSTATKILREKLDIPVFEVITPAAKLASQVTKNNHIGIIGTRATISSRIYEQHLKNINKDIKVFSNPSPLLVPLIEEGFIKAPETKRIVKKYLIPLKTRQIDTLILGCTHYPILKDIIDGKAGKKVKIIDSSTAIANDIKEYIDNCENPEKFYKNLGKSIFFVSDITPQFGKLAKSILKFDVNLNHIKL